MEIRLEVSGKLKMKLSYDPVIPHLGTQSFVSQCATETFVYPCLLLHIRNNKEGIDPV